MTGVLDGIERVVIESKDGDLIATITEDEINWNPEFQVRIKSTVPKHKLFISCPTKDRTEEDIKKSFEVLKRTAEAYTGETLSVVNPYVPKIFESDADRIISISESIKLMADADYFITIEKYWEDTECSVEDLIAGRYGMKRMLAMTEFAAPDFLKKIENLVPNPYYKK